MADLFMEENDDETISGDEFVASYAWHSAFISAAYYNTSTLELFLARESVDLKPDFWHLKNLFRQLNVRTVLASGPNIFLTTIMELLNMSPTENPGKYSVNVLKSTNNAKFVVFIDNPKNRLVNIKRILNMKLSNMNDMSTEQERSNFIKSVIPLGQHLVVRCLGNLLNHLDTNWKHMFLRADPNVVISDMHIYSLDTQMLIDEATYAALQIFSAKEHPSGFKRSTQGSLSEGLSLYRIMNKCRSRIGAREMKMVLQQPIRDLAELRSRQATIEWFCDERNANIRELFISALKKIGSVSDQFQRLVSSQGNPTMLKNFKATIYYTTHVAELCTLIMSEGGEDIKGTIIEDLAKHHKDKPYLQDVLKAINVVVDMEEGLEIGRFCVRYGLDKKLDELKIEMLNILQVLSTAAKKELANLPHCINEVTGHYVPELGFMFTIPITQIDNPSAMSGISNLNFRYQTKDTFYFDNAQCLDLNEKHGNLYTDIFEKENEILDRLLNYIRDHLAALQFATKLCARLDCFLSMAEFCVAHQLRKPELLGNGKVLEILNGRHILMDIKTQCVANSTSINVDKRNLITVLIAPNGSGKSVYLKEVAQIVYLAHIGCFVPAETARISLMESIYTRIYTPESMYQAKSSFFNELVQMGNVTTNSSTHSLILVDELGQSTRDMDGYSLVLSCLQHLVDRGDLSPITILSTHFNGVYDAMMYSDWIQFKTFRMLANPDGSVSSTYELIDGYFAGSHAKDSREAKQIINRSAINIIEQSGFPGPNDNTKTGVVDVSQRVYQAKVDCAARMVHAYVKFQQTNDEHYKNEILNMFNNCRL